MSNYEDGLKKKSFELSYNNGSIWCEHLDGLFDKRDLVIKKFTEDLNVIKCPSTSSFIAINLDETDVDKKLLDFIIGTLNTLEKRICKVVIVGLGPMMKVHIRKINTGVNGKYFSINFGNYVSIITSI